MKSEGDYTEAKVAKATKQANRSIGLAEQAAEAGAFRTYGTCNHPAHQNGSVFCPRIKGLLWMMAGYWSLLAFIFVPGLTYHIIRAWDSKVDAVEGSDVAHIVARAVEVNTTVSVTDSACTVLSGTTYPTPSSVSVPATMHAPTVSLTGGVFVTPMASTSATDSSCAAPETVTVTVTVTSQATADAMAGTASAGGAPPQSGETSTTVFTTITTTSTFTSTATLDRTSTGSITSTTTENHSSPSLIHTLGTGTNGIGVYATGTGGTGFVHGTGTASFGLQPSVNGSLTYSMPTVTPSHPLTTIVSSSASAGSRGGSGSKRDQQRGSKSGFYCVVMAVACGVALAVV